MSIIRSLENKTCHITLILAMCQSTIIYILTSSIVQTNFNNINQSCLSTYLVYWLNPKSISDPSNSFCPFSQLLNFVVLQDNFNFRMYCFHFQEHNTKITFSVSRHFELGDKGVNENIHNSLKWHELLIELWWKNFVDGGHKNKCGY